jgi:hypothetical protein
LYYEVNQRYEYYVPFRAIFADEQIEAMHETAQGHVWRDLITELPGVRLALLAGVLVKGSTSDVDLLLVGEIPTVKLRNVVKQIEASESRELNYAILSYDEFYYRLSVRDKFITEILNGKHAVLVDTDTILKAE